MGKTFVCFLFIFFSFQASGQLYEEYFTDGSAQLSWFPEWGGSDMEVISVVGNPSADGWVGKLSNEMSPPVGTALAGASDLGDYLIEAYIYCVVTPGGPMSGPYEGVVARWDTTGPTSEATYYSLIADFDGSQRIRLASVVGATPSTLKEWVGDSIPGGVPTESGWHKLGLKLKGDSIWAYFDDFELSGSPFYDTFTSEGFFGVYVFNMVATDSVLCDDIVVSGVTGVEERDNHSLASTLVYAYPNPFADDVTIVREASEGLVTLNILDCQGRVVRTTNNRSSGGSVFRWDGRFDSGEKAPPGVYFFRLASGKSQSSGKLIYLK